MLCAEEHQKTKWEYYNFFFFSINIGQYMWDFILFFRIKVIFLEVIKEV